jgi:hypothetical protein
MEQVPESLYNIGVKAVIENAQGQFLALRIARKDGGSMYWDLPGGRIQDA